MQDVSTQCDETCSTLPLDSLSCLTCDVTWCLTPLKTLDAGIELSVFGERLYCRLCRMAIVRRTTTETNDDAYAHDFENWHKRLIQFQDFHCCLCGNFASTRHKLREHPNGVLRVYSFKYYLGHQFCYYCLFNLIRKRSSRLLPKLCCQV